MPPPDHNCWTSCRRQLTRLSQGFYVSSDPHRLSSHSWNLGSGKPHLSWRYPSHLYVLVIRVVWQNWRQLRYFTQRPRPSTPNCTAAGREFSIKTKQTLHRTPSGVAARTIGERPRGSDSRVINFLQSSSRDTDIVLRKRESTEENLCTRKRLLAGRFVRMSDRRLPKRISFRDPRGRSNEGVGKEKERTGCVESEVRTVGILGDSRAT